MPGSIETIAVAARYLGELAPEAAALSEQVFKASIADTLRHPSRLIDVLPELSAIFERKGMSGSNLNLPEINRALARGSELAQRKITRFLGSGESEFVLATEDNTALKLSSEVLYRPVANPAFDAPIVNSGRIGEKHFFYEQPVGDTAGVTDRHVVDVVKRIRSSDHLDEDIFDTTGIRRDQVALFGVERKPLLIDQRSAIPLYGLKYDGGTLVADSQQKSNLAEISEFLDRRGIVLKKSVGAAPTNSLSYYSNSYTNKISDGALRDAVIGHLETVDQAPTFSTNWTDREAEVALRSLLK